MKESKALEEVWEWKNAVYEETKEMNKDEIYKYFNRDSETFLNRAGYKKIKIADGVYTIKSMNL